MSEPWYQDGLYFACTRCGNCCTGEPGFVWVTDEEIAGIAEALKQPVEEVTAMYTKQAHSGRSLREKPNGDCVLYDRELGCTVYEARPRQCRTWPFWQSTAGTPAAWERTKTICPGAGKGDWVPADEITRRIHLIKL